MLGWYYDWQLSRPGVLHDVFTQRSLKCTNFIQITDDEMNLAQSFPPGSPADSDEFFRLESRSHCPSLPGSAASTYVFQSQTGSAGVCGLMLAAPLCIQLIRHINMTHHLNYGQLVWTAKQAGTRACIRVAVGGKKEDTAHFWRSLHFQKWGLSRADIN